MVDFSEMQLRAELVEALRAVGFVHATEVQELAIPQILAGRSAVVRAKTGTGKTGAFLVPLINEMVHPRGIVALVIVPTRELALQVSEFSKRAFGRLGVRTVTVYGGASINMQVKEIESGANIVVGTPGRLLDLLERGVLYLGGVKYVVLDEADIMLDMGFVDDVERILSVTAHDKRLLMFSATMPREILEIAKRHVNGDSVSITVGDEEDLTVETIKHTFYVAEGKAKFSALLAYIDKFAPKKAIIFAATKHEADVVHRFLLQNGKRAMVMHGDLTQAKRERSLVEFKSGAQFLIATNIAARGLDIADITDIINFDIPDDPHIYVHRVGRSARMGKEGRAFSLVRPAERDTLKVIEYMANVKINRIDLDTGKFSNIIIPSRFDSGPRRYGGGGFRDRGRPEHGGGRGNWHRSGRKEREWHRGTGR